MSDDKAWFAEGDLDPSRWRALVEPLLEMAAQAIRRDRFPHGLLLAGPAGMGRELAAVELAAMLVSGEPGPWSTAAAAGRVRAGIHPDVALLMPPLDAKSKKRRKHVVVEQIRELVEGAPARPYEGRARVWILAGAERGELGDEAANAFLKLLEEPPAHCRFLLLAGNPERVLPTVRSRCQLLSLPGPLAAARVLGAAASVPELAAPAAASEPLAEGLAAAREALTAGTAGSLEPVLRLPAVLEETLVGGVRMSGVERRAALGRAFELVAVAALEMATSESGEHCGDGLVRLAVDCLERSRRMQVLNLDPTGQLLAALTSWFDSR